MKRSAVLTEDLIFKFKLKRVIRVEGHEEFKLINQTEETLNVTGTDGVKMPIPTVRIMQGIELVRKNPSIYKEGPTALESAGMSQASMQVWSILHLMTLEQLLA